MLKLVSLNIEGDKHFDRFLPMLEEEQPDVVCLQEVFAQDLPYLEQKLHMQSVYAPNVVYLTPNQYGIAPRGTWGITLLSKLPLVQPVIHYYHGGKQRIPVFIDGQPNSANRAVILAQVTKDEQLYQVATTHFTWSAQGKINEAQGRDFISLSQFLSHYSSLILTGDFNAPRGRELFQKFADHFQDQIPPQIQTTLDPQLHYAGPLDLVVDGLFTTPDYIVSDVKLVAGVSDHQAIVAEIE